MSYEHNQFTFARVFAQQAARTGSAGEYLYEPVYHLGIAGKSYLLWPQRSTSKSAPGVETGAGLGESAYFPKLKDESAQLLSFPG